MSPLRLRSENHGYGVYVDDVRVGRVWNRPGRSFSGGWSGVHSSGRSCGSRHFTRAEAVAAVLAEEAAYQDANGNTCGDWTVTP